MEFREEALQNLLLIQAERAKNKCEKVKEVGDRVLVWDGSYSTDKDSGEHYYGTHQCFSEPCIVVEINQDFIKTEYLVSIGYRSYLLDLVVFSPTTNRLIRTSSNFCKVL